MKFNHQLIESYLCENNMSKSIFCKRCKISHSTLQKFYTHNLDLGLSQLFKVAKFLEVKAYELVLDE